MPKPPHPIRSNPEKLEFIASHCKDVTLAQMAKALGVSWTLLTCMQKEFGWQFKDPGMPKNRLPRVIRGKRSSPPIPPKHVVTEQLAAPRFVRPAAVYSNSSPYGIADELHRSR